MNPALFEKRILVTGATGAIGGAVALAAKQAGAEVFGSYAGDAARAGEMEKAGIRMFQADLADPAQVRRLVEQVLQAAGSLDALVYAAGNTGDRTLAKMTDGEWDRVIAVHLTGLSICCRALLPSMQKQKRGKIVAFGSQVGLTGRVGQANYSAAKAGTIGFIRTLAREAGRFGVTANVICPGFIDSKMTRSAAPEAWERARAASTLGEVSSVETVASFICWLLSDSCRGVTGQVFQLDSRIL